CPSGALSYSINGEVVEPDLPQEIAVTPDGALWVSGGIPIERADGQPCEVRNRVTLCRCGASNNQPYCDGTHKEDGFRERSPRQGRPRLARGVSHGTWAAQVPAWAGGHAAQ